jgi:hypothetical protein
MMTIQTIKFKQSFDYKQSKAVNQVLIPKPKEQLFRIYKPLLRCRTLE